MRSFLNRHFLVTCDFRVQINADLAFGTPSFSASFAVTSTDEGLQVGPQSGSIKITLAQLLGTIDKRLSAAGLDQVGFTFSSLAFTTSKPYTIRFSGSIQVYSATVPFDIYVVIGDSVQFGLLVDLTSAANAAFQRVYKGVTADTNTPVSLSGIGYFILISTRVFT